MSPVFVLGLRFRGLLLATALSCIGEVAWAQYGPLDWPYEPHVPLSGVGWYQRQKAGRQFYEMWGTHYRASEATAHNALREQRMADIQAREETSLKRLS